MAKQIVVAEDVAQVEFDRFIEEMDLDIDKKGMDDEDKKSFEDAHRNIIRAMMRGTLVIDDKGQPVYTPVAGGEPLVFREPKGADRMQMDEKKESHKHKRLYALIGAMTGNSVQRFADMPQRDLKVVEGIGMLFMAG